MAISKTGNYNIGKIVCQGGASILDVLYNLRDVVNKLSEITYVEKHTIAYGAVILYGTTTHAQNVYVEHLKERINEKEYAKKYINYINNIIKVIEESVLEKALVNQNC